ncbi:MAG: LCP family protein [Armatimonadetes bacterium]|nr:LCP family protein [Armatimonadota bacterium]MDE2205416.1 LCP family protein [Armatimonadota bacterium]
MSDNETGGSTKGVGARRLTDAQVRARRAKAAQAGNAPAARKAPRRGWVLVRRMTAVTSLVLIAGVGAFAGRMWRNRIFRNVVLTGLSHPVTSLLHGVGANYTPDNFFPGQTAVNIALMGCDHDYENGVPVPILNSPARTDALMIAHVDFLNNTITVVSIPRDTAVEIPGHGICKINAAHAFGGPQLTEATVQRVFGISTDRYISMSFEGFQKIVNSMGGVSLLVNKPLNYDDNWANLHVHLSPGFQHLNGYQAMGFVRIRHSDSDLMRLDRQHEFLAAMRQKAKDPAIWASLPDVLDAVTNNIQTDMTDDQLLTLVNFARQVPHTSVEFDTLPSTEGPSYVYTQVPQSEAMIRRVFFNNNPDAPVNVDVPDMRMVRYTGVRRRTIASRPWRRRSAAAVTGGSSELTPPVSVDEPAVLPPGAAPPMSPSTSPVPSAPSGGGALGGTAAGGAGSGHGGSPDGGSGTQGGNSGTQAGGTGSGSGKTPPTQPPP